MHTSAELAETGRELLDRYLLTAERIAPQHVRTSAELAETVRTLLDRSREVRALGGRMRV